MKHPSDRLGLSHLLIETLAEFALKRLADVYFGKVKSVVASSTMHFAERSELSISGIFHELFLVFDWRQGCGVTITWGMKASTLMSSTKSPNVSVRRIPVSESNEIYSENMFRNAANAFIEEKDGNCRITSGKVVVQP